MISLRALIGFHYPANISLFIDFPCINKSIVWLISVVSQKFVEQVVVLFRVVPAKANIQMF
jgi:hypothetical protein